jgi:hypothetical protein
MLSFSIPFHIADIGKMVVSGQMISVIHNKLIFKLTYFIQVTDFLYKQQMLLLNAVQWQTYMQLYTYENYTLYTDTHKLFPVTNITKVSLERSGGGACVCVCVCIYIYIYIYMLCVCACMHLCACLITTTIKHVAPIYK